MTKLYRKKGTTPMHPYTPGEDMTGVSISPSDLAKGSPKIGDMIANNPKDPSDRWLVEEKYMDNYEEVE